MLGLIMGADEILEELRGLGSKSYKEMLMRNHGVREPSFGVKIGDLKKLQKRIKINHQLAIELYDTGNYDAMYLAGLIVDDSRMTPADLQRWVDNAIGGALANATVAGVATGSAHGWEMALKWIEARDKPHIAEAGWSTLAGLAAVTADKDLDLAALRALVDRVAKTIDHSADPVRYAMNGFLIALGSYVKPLSAYVIETAESIGEITADLGPNNCKIPFAPDSIRKIEQRGAIGKKRKSIKC
jgi:3-methyladenine DNA glycosylase AlkD